MMNNNSVRLCGAFFRLEDIENGDTKIPAGEITAVSSVDDEDSDLSVVKTKLLFYRPAAQEDLNGIRDGRASITGRLLEKGFVEVFHIQQEEQTGDLYVIAYQKSGIREIYAESKKEAALIARANDDAVVEIYGPYKKVQ